MKTRREIESQLRSLLRKELDSRLHRKLPVLCTHNHRQPLDHRRIVSGEPNENYNKIVSSSGGAVSQTIGLCMLGAKSVGDWPGTICEDEIDAKRCPYFTRNQTPREVYDQFLEDLSGKPVTREVEVLLWVLGDKQPKVSRWRALWWFKAPLWLGRLLSVFKSGKPLRSLPARKAAEILVPPPK